MFGEAAKCVCVCVCFVCVWLWVVTCVSGVRVASAVCVLCVWRGRGGRDKEGSGGEEFARTSLDAYTAAVAPVADVLSWGCVCTARVTRSDRSLEIWREVGSSRPHGPMLSCSLDGIHLGHTPPPLWNRAVRAPSSPLTASLELWKFVNKQGPLWIGLLFLQMKTAGLRPAAFGSWFCHPPCFWKLTLECLGPPFPTDTLEKPEGWAASLDWSLREHHWLGFNVAEMMARGSKSRGK